MAPDSYDNRTVIAELRRRKVIRVAVVYAVVAFVVIQVADMVFPALQLPPWTVTFVVVLALLGFPLALVLAWAFELTPDGVRRTEPAPAQGVAPGAGRSAEPEPRPGEEADSPAAGEDPAGSGAAPPGAGAGAIASRRSALWFVVGFLIALTTAWVVIQQRGGADDDVAADLVAILPFRVSADPGVAYLREGMVDLLAAALTGETGLRAVETTTLLSAWRRAVASENEDLSQDAAVSLARALGAGRVLLGSVVGSPDRIVITVTVHDASSGRTGSPVAVEGSLDGLFELVDRLTAQLLAREAGEAPERLAALTSTSLPALRLYLEGQALHRRGRFDDATDRFRRAVELDSTFALAGLRLNRSAGWGLPPRDDLAQLGLELAWAHRHRLGLRDRMLLEALAGPRYPEPSTYAERLAVWERLVRDVPDAAEAWYELAEVIFHFGRLLDMDDPLEYAGRAFDRALALDSSFGAARQHALHIAVFNRDTAKLRALGGLELAHDMNEDERALLLAVAAVMLEDTSSSRLMEERLQAADPVWLRVVLLAGQLFPEVTPSDLAHRAAPAIATASRRPGAEPADFAYLHAYHVNAGRPSAAAEWAVRGARSAGDASLPYRRRILDALFNLGDAAAAAGAADSLRARLGPAAGDGDIAYHRDVCVLGQWYAARGESTRANDAASSLRRAAAGAAGGAAAGAGMEADLCADLLETVVAYASGAADAPSRIRRLDESLAQGPPLLGLREEANLTLVGLLESIGEREAAFRAARRVEFGGSPLPYLTALLREEARLADALGRTDAAIEAYLHAAALLAEPEPGPPADAAAEVRQALARLTGGDAAP